MKFKFNLSEYWTREAMGAPQFINREQPLECWDYEELTNAPEESQDPRILSWREHLQNEPSLAKILQMAAKKNYKTMENMVSTYGITPEEARSIFKIFIGYEPMQGGYLFYVGPYFSEGYIHGPEHIVQDAVDRFGYFPHKFRNATPKEITNSINSAIKKYSELWGNYGLEVDASDFRLIDSLPGEIDVNGEQQPTEIVQEVNNLAVQPLLPNPNNDPEIEAQNEQIHRQNLVNNPEGTQLFNKKPLLSNADIKLNNKGFEKLMKAVVGPWHDEAMAERAATIMRQKGVTEEQARQEIETGCLNDYSYLEDFYNKVRKKYLNAVNTNDPRAMQLVAQGVPPPPSFNQRSMTVRSGQRQTGKVPTNKYMYQLLMFRKKIVNLLKEGVTDVAEITRRVNEGVPLNKQVRQDKIAQEITKITDSRRELQKAGKQGNLDEIDQEVEGYLTELRQLDSGKGIHGFKDFKTAFEMLSLHLANPPTLKLTETSDIMSSDLSSIREQRKEQGEEGEEGILTDEQLEKDLGEDILPPEQEKTPALTPPAPQPFPVPPKLEEEKEEEEENLLSLLSNTLRNLIKIARELDESGKEEAAEEVHKVIRKYQKGIV